MLYSTIGALTLKQYSFQSRPWELTITECMDIFDFFGNPILFEFRGGLLRKIMPSSSNWISNITRFAYDGLIKSRLSLPYNILGTKISSFLQGIIPVSWTYIISQYITFFPELISEMKKNIGPILSLDQLLLIKLFYINNQIYTHYNLNNLTKYIQFSDTRINFLTNSLTFQLSNFSSFLLININARLEIPILLSKLRIILKKSTTVTSSLKYRIKTKKKRCFSFIQLPQILSSLVSFHGSFLAFTFFLQGKSILCNLISKNILILFNSVTFTNQNISILLTLINNITKLTKNNIQSFFITAQIAQNHHLELNLNTLKILKKKNKKKLITSFAFKFLKQWKQNKIMFNFHFLKKKINFLSLFFILVFLPSSINFINIFIKLITNFIKIYNTTLKISTIHLYKSAHIPQNFSTNLFNIFLPLKGFGERSFLYQSGLNKFSFFYKFRKSLKLSLSDFNYYELSLFYLNYFKTHISIFSNKNYLTIMNTFSNTNNLYFYSLPNIVNFFFIKNIKTYSLSFFQTLYLPFSVNKQLIGLTSFFNYKNLSFF